MVLCSKQENSITKISVDFLFLGLQQYLNLILVSYTDPAPHYYTDPHCLPTHTRCTPPTFIAIDFETADYGRESACVLALVRVEVSAIVQRAFHYIRPPRHHFHSWHTSCPGLPPHRWLSVIGSA